jgi:hypothetical protein
MNVTGCACQYFDYGKNSAPKQLFSQGAVLFMDEVLITRMNQSN